jgi:uncharacterized protein YndB with AHSA1/START domain
MTKVKTIETEVSINAPIQKVWDVIMKTNEWNRHSPPPKCGNNIFGRRRQVSQ